MPVPGILPVQAAAPLILMPQQTFDWSEEVPSTGPKARRQGGFLAVEVEVGVVRHLADPIRASEQESRRDEGCRAWARERRLDAALQNQRPAPVELLRRQKRRPVTQQG